jgi:hypothetical protein
VRALRLALLEEMINMRNTSTGKVLVAVLLVGAVVHSAGAADLKSIGSAEPIEVESGTPLADVLAKLPSTTTLTLDTGDPDSVPLTWNLSEFVVCGAAGNVVRQTYLPARRGA